MPTNRRGTPEQVGDELLKLGQKCEGEVDSNMANTIVTGLATVFAAAVSSGNYELELGYSHNHD